MTYKELLRLISKGENEQLEFKRTLASGVPQTICALSNTFGGKIIIGIADDGEVVGVDNTDDALQKLSDLVTSIVPPVVMKTEIFTIDTTSIVVIEVRRSNRLHSYRNIAYVRAGRNNRPISPQELLAIAGESLMVSFDMSQTKIPVEQADRDLVQEFFEQRAEARGVKPSKKLQSTESLIQLGVVHQERQRNLLNSTGVLFFTRQPQDHYSSACVEVMRFSDDSMKELVERQKITGPITRMVEKTFDILNQMNPRVELILTGRLRRKTVVLYPELALREAVLNAVIHRNYFDPGYVQIFIFPNRISVRNPGAFPYGVTPENPIHRPRNPMISTLMYELGYVEKYGSGIKRIMAEVKQNDLVYVNYDEFVFYTEITFTRKSEIPGVDETDKRILDLLRSVHKSSELSQALGLSTPTVVKRLNRLVSAGVVVKKGRGRSTYYILPS